MRQSLSRGHYQLSFQPPEEVYLQNNVTHVQNFLVTPSE